MSDDKVIDISTRKRLESIPTEADTKPAQFLKTWMRFCKDTKVKSVMIVTIDESDHCTYGSLSDDEHHLALMALTLPDLEQELKDKIFGDFDLELED